VRMIFSPPSSECVLTSATEDGLDRSCCRHSSFRCALAFSCVALFVRALAHTPRRCRWDRTLRQSSRCHPAHITSSIRPQLWLINSAAQNTPSLFPNPEPCAPCPLWSASKGKIFRA
jgi:hypothetical protein